MDDDLAAAVGRTWRDDRPWRLLTDLTELNRMAGHPGETRALERVRTELAEASVADLRTESFPMTRWDRGATTLAVTSPAERTFEAVALPYSPAGDVAGPLVDVGYGTRAEIESADLDGAIAVASTTTPPGGRFVHRMEKFGHAHEAGAAAFVFVNHVPGQLPPTGSLRFDEVAAMPGVGVSAETGDWLTEYARRAPGAETPVEARDAAASDRAVEYSSTSPRSHAREDSAGEAHLRVDADHGDGESGFVHGTLGPDTDEEALVLAHVDAHDVAEGALDNGCGVATLVGAARVLADADLDLQIRVAAVGSEEVGLLGADALADRLDLDAVRAAVNVDGAGRHRDLVAMTHASDALGEVAEAVRADAGHPVDVDSDPHPYSDHWPFLRAGVPAVQLHSDSGERGRGWGHTAADTRDKVDPRNLRSHAILTALLVRRLTDRDVSRIDREALRAAMVDREFESGMRAAGIWPEDWD
jgi:Zn-dependent M28 family amino/carboxypeptidase